MADGPTAADPERSGGIDPAATTRPLAGAPPQSPAQGHPERIGRYSILRVLGEGGMGTVYEARQEKPSRAVALKVMRAGSFSPSLLRRFEHESQVLGRLQHPGIAQIYEAGIVGGGTAAHGGGPPIPFFAMEFIRGVPLTDYARQRSLGARQRLDLVARVCDAVYHAHQKGVIHRDLKPGNILVDDSGQPKILDFGVARATDSDLQQTTLQTDIGQLIGTVPYMSPEQVSGDPAELDTRSDVYALGVIAYELLAGRLPYDLSRRMIHEAVRVIREEEPARLSSIDRALRGDIETIVAKALEKDKARRYQSAESLASDIRRYLKDEPIAARPASTWYQLSKFSRRNRGLVAGIIASFLVLLGGLAATLWQARIAQRQRDSATTESNRAIQAEAQTRERANELKEVADFQAQMLAQVDTKTAGLLLSANVRRKFEEALIESGVPDEDRRREIEAFASSWRRVNATDLTRDLIDDVILKPSVDVIDKQFANQPLVDATLRQVLSARYKDFGLYESAVPLQERALETRRRVLGQDHPDTVGSMDYLGVLLRQRGDLERAESCLMEAFQRAKRLFGPEHSDTLKAMYHLAQAMLDMGRLDEAEAYCRDGLETARRVMGDNHRAVAGWLNGMAEVFHSRGRADLAEAYFRQARDEQQRVQDGDDLELLAATSNVAVVLSEQGKLAEAEPFVREVLEKRRKLMGEEHPETLAAILNVGSLLQDQGRFVEAQAHFRESIEKSRRVLGDDHPVTLVAIGWMGSVLQEQGRPDQAEPYLRERLETSRRVLGQEHPDTLGAIRNLGSLLRAMGRLQEAEPLYREALEKHRRVLGDDHPATAGSLNNMGALLDSLGRPDEAEPCYREALDTLRRALGDEHPNTLHLTSNLGDLLRAQGKYAQAEAILLPAAAVAQAKLPPKNPINIALTRTIGKLYDAWNTAEPGGGYEVKAAEWRIKLEALVAPGPPMGGD